MTTFRDGTKEEGKYKYNVLITSQKKKHLFLIRSAKFRERIEAAVSSSQRASKYALQKADIAVSRTATARSKAEMADSVADHARVDSEIAVATAREFAPDFKPSVLDRFERLRVRDRYRPNEPPSMPNTKPSTAQANSNNTTPNHLPTDNRIQASTDSTPQKQISFPQAPARRQSMLQKQASIDYPPGTIPGVYPTGPLPQHVLYPIEQSPQTQPSQQYQQSKSYQDQYNYGNQDTSNATNYNMPNQNYYSQPNTQQFNNSNYMGNVPQMQSKYPNNMQMQSQYGSGGGGETHTQYAQQQMTQSQYNTHMPMNQTNQMNQSAYQNYNQQLDGGHGYQLGAAAAAQSQYSHQSYANQNQVPQMQSTNYDQIDNSHDVPGPSNLRRNSRALNDTARPPHIGSFSQSSIDHYDHYKRPPSRDSSVDRYARAASRLSGSRQPSIDRSILPTTNNSNPSQNPTADNGSIDRNVRAGSAFRNVASVAMSPAAPVQTGEKAFIHIIELPSKYGFLIFLFSFKSSK